MNLLSQLQAAANPRKRTPRIPPKSEHWMLNDPEKVAQAVAKSLAKRKAKHYALWSKAFGGKPRTAEELATIMCRSVRSINNMLRVMRNYDPPPVTIIGKVETCRGGNEKYIHAWIAE